MLILQPTSGEKRITIAPRSSNDDFDFEQRVLADGAIYEGSPCLSIFEGQGNPIAGFSMNLRRDGDGKEEVITDISFSNILV